MTDVRPAVPADGPAVREIQSLAIDEPWPALLEAALEGAVPLLVLDESGPTGYAIAVPGEGGVVYVPELAVHPERQGAGRGSRLLSALFDRYRGYEELRLTVRETDRRVRRFYDRHGFERVERVDDHFESADGLLLTRSLGEAGTDAGTGTDTGTGDR